ncbi:sigma-54-dependent transcriptional regulator [Pseudoalteromonas aurantia]|uniref:Sigma-54-dependent Fis family transcriptional regulator n=1 Tax=Pseudoalteromonas aurantia TaxID=43654 RepID=A0ABY2W1Z3_9GAMM|nr:sigma-54 dependent transcriptional regulator [Pseudoalteromonas aurantia]TMO59038.1 sigma-54-dependent Fis family transcriptional regulator [Pseudoalteromonas aurantia]TMO78090.1 sigma-54-dependent Fis family transcriptional regulator [Pseudoalteromonas aurantia]
MSASILIADDDEGILHALSLMLLEAGHVATTVLTPADTLIQLRQCEFDLVIIDLNFSLDTTSGAEGLSLLKSIKQLYEHLPVLVMTGWGSVEVAVQAMQNGANDFIKKPWENERLLSIITNQLALANTTLNARKLRECNALLNQQIDDSDLMVSDSPAIQHVLNTLNRVALSDIDVLITGENGTGKSMFARYLHAQSSRKTLPMISVNMGAVADNLFESEMFGHVKGAFTDAKNHRIGRFELAEKSSLFLDEVANTPLSQQGKLLRVLEERQFEKVGASKTQHADIRLICATNADLKQAVSDGAFRQDLLYRINTIEVCIPPLRERQLDIIPLARKFLHKAIEKYKGPAVELDNKAKQALLKYGWPGNVRELSHVIERAHILGQQPTVTVADLNLPTHSRTITPIPNNDDTLRPLEELEHEILKSRLAYFDGDAVAAATSLGLSRSTFYRRLSKANND